ncbi:cupredoxin domain-containing protein [Cupriavidus plantarum]|uniref:cupredoxin domain-containing protein n=1 Tax=Cupriavidus plantarum TaxID=942865 RepID=UPI00339D6BA3
MNPTKNLLLAMAMAPLVALAAGNSGNHREDHDQTTIGHVGEPGNPSRVIRTVKVAMHDSMRFTPDRISVKAGDTVRFVVRNTGKVEHEMVIGTNSELREHAQMMRDMPMAGHVDSNQISLAPGLQGSLIWKFDRPGTADFACLLPGHYEAGMVGRVTVK